MVKETLGADAAEALDLFDRVLLASVLQVVSTSRSLSEAGRVLFASSRERKNSSNDADRLRKYLAHFGVTLESLRERLHS